jgi:hypothetical protein
MSIDRALLHDGHYIREVRPVRGVDINVNWRPFGVQADLRVGTSRQTIEAFVGKSIYLAPSTRRSGVSSGWRSSISSSRKQVLQQNMLEQTTVCFLISAGSLSIDSDCLDGVCEECFDLSIHYQKQEFNAYARD